MERNATHSYSGKTAPLTRGSFFSKTANGRGSAAGVATGAILEHLEDRTLQSAVWLADGVLNIDGGTDSKLDVNVGYDARHGEIKVHVKGQSRQEFLRSAVSEINIVGTNGNDDILIAKCEPVGADIQGLDGNDLIVGGGGSDTIICGAGRDRVYGRGGNDVIYGGAGDDSLYGGRGNDQLTAGSGNTLLDGGSGHNQLVGGVGKDTFRNGTGDFGRVGARGRIVKGPRSVSSSPSTGNSVGPSDTTSDTGTTTDGSTSSGSTTDSGTTDSTGTTDSGSTGSTGSGDTGSTGSTGSGTTGSTGSGTTGSTGSGTTGSTGSGTTGSTGSGTTGSTGSGSTGSTGSGTTSNGQNAPTAVIDFLDQSGMAGHTIEVDGLNSVIHNGTATDATFQWNFGDPNGAFNNLTGFNAAHRYAQAGTYTVTLTVTDNTGATSITTGTVSISADTRRLIYVNSQTGNDANTGASPNSPIQTLAQAAKMLGSDTEVLLCRGQTYSLANTINISAHNLLFGAYGEGANPTIMKGTGNGNYCFYTAPTCNDVSFQDLNIDSIWGLNSVYGTKKVPASGFALGGKNLSIIDCTFHNVTDAIDTEAQPTGVLIQGNTMGPELRGYGIWGEGYDHVYIGNTMTNSLQEHLIRADTGTGDIALSHVLIAFNNLSRPDNSKGSIELRTCTWFYVASNTINGGTLRVGLQENADFAPNWATMKTGEGVIENNTTYGIFYNFRPGAFDVVVRNNVIHVDNAPAIGIECIKAGYDQVRKTSDLRFYNNTVIDNGKTGTFMQVDGNATGLVVDSNVMVAPNLVLNGNGQSGAIYVTNGTLSSFTAIENNIWPALSSTDKQAGLNYVGPVNAVASDYVTNQAWNALPQVGDDTFQDVTLDSDDYTVTMNNYVAGATLKAA